MSQKTIRIGMIGLDTSHVGAFTRLLHDREDPNHVPGAQIVAGYPGGTPDWPKSADRVEGFTQALRDDYGVAILDSPEAVADAADVVFITAVDGRRHRALLEQVIDRGKPVFVDKPFATTPEDAQAMVDLADREGVALMSCSSVRYADPLRDALADDALGPIQGMDVFGPMALERGLPGLFWYGCHGIEVALSVMGPGVAEVRSVATQSTDVHTLVWPDGRMASYRGMRGCKPGFGATIFREDGFQQVKIQAGARPYYVGLLRAVLDTLPHGRSDVSREHMVEVVRVLAAGNEARESGAPVSLDPISV